MVTTKKQRMVVDIGMVCLFPLLMAYSLIGELFHEVIGTLMMILMLGHLWQNRRWIFAIPKGSYTPRRTFQTILDLLLMVFMILQPISGILMSKHLYTFIQIPGISALMRQIHMVLAYWGFVLMSMHAGTHLMPMIRKIQKAAFPVKAATLACIAAISLYGAYAFVKRQIAEYMFMRTMFVFFDFSENRIRFLADYLTVMVFFAMLGLIATAVLSSSKEKKEKGDL